MSIGAMFAANPAYRAIKARDAFDATLEVTIQDWSKVQSASCWCEERWLEHQLHYRRRVHSDQCQATFEFDDDSHAIEFLMRFGSGCRNL